MPLIVVVAVASGGAAVVGGAVATFVGLGAVSTAAATAIGAGLISGGVTALQGGDAGDVLKSAVLGGVTTYVGGVIGEKVAGSVSAAAADKFPALAQTFGNIAGAAAAGGTSEALMAAAYGGDPIEALIKGGLTAGLSATALSGIQALTKQSTSFTSLPDPAQRAINSALAAKTLGQNPTQAAVSELAESAGAYLKTQLKDFGKELKDTYGKTKTAAKALEDNIASQKTLAESYNNAIEDYNIAASGWQSVYDDYLADKKIYDQKVADYNSYYGSRLGAYYKNKLDEFIPTINKSVAAANDYIADLDAKKANINSYKTDYDNAVAAFDDLYNKFDYQQSVLAATTDKFTAQEAENADLVSKTYKSLTDTKDTFQESLGRAPTTKELKSLFNTGDIETAAGEYITQKKWETMSPDEQFQAQLDFLYGSTADVSGTTLPVRMFTTPKSVQNMPGFEPRPGETAGEITPVLMEDGSYAYSRKISGTTKDGKPYEYEALYDPLKPNAEVEYFSSGTVSGDLPAGNVLPGQLVTGSKTRPVVDTQFPTGVGVDGDTIDISGTPILYESRSQLKAPLPSGTRLATLQEADANDLQATTLAGGQMAFLMPDTYRPEMYQTAVKSAVSSKLRFDQASKNLQAAQTELSNAQASGNASAIKTAADKVAKAKVDLTSAETDKSTDVSRLQEVLVEGQRDREYRYLRAKELMGEKPSSDVLRAGEPPANIVSNVGFDFDLPEVDLYGIIESQPPTPDWKEPSLKERFLKSSLLKKSGYKSIFDPIEETMQTFEDVPTDSAAAPSQKETPDMYLPFSDIEPPPAPTTPETDPYAYSMQNIPQAAATDPFIDQQKPAAPSFYNYGSPNTLLSLTQTPFTSAPTAPTVTLARGGLAHLATGGKPNPFAALFSATGGLGKVPHKGSHYVQGAGGGQDDLIDARLADGEYVFDADIVAALGDGSNKEGAKRLDKMREAIRAHKRSAPNDKIPPKAKSPLAYLREAK